MRQSDIHKEKVKDMVRQGWEIGDEYPKAGVTILYRNVSLGVILAVTVLKNGKIRMGEHPPK